MAIKWNSIGTDHVTRAFELLAKDSVNHNRGGRSLFVTHQGLSLPAKDVMRLAYLLANRLPPDTKVKFSSGEGIMARLTSLGFAVERRGVARTTTKSRNAPTAEPDGF